MITDFLRAQAGWRLVNARCDPVRTARCAAALLDAAAYAATLGDNDPHLAALARGGCFRGEVFDPGPQGISLARWWQFSDGECARPRDLISALAARAGAAQAGTVPSRRAQAGPVPAGPVPAGPVPAGPAQAGAVQAGTVRAGPQRRADAPAAGAAKHGARVGSHRKPG